MHRCYPEAVVHMFRCAGQQVLCHGVALYAVGAAHGQTCTAELSVWLGTVPVSSSMHCDDKLHATAPAISSHYITSCSTRGTRNSIIAIPHVTWLDLQASHCSPAALPCDGVCNSWLNCPDQSVHSADFHCSLYSRQQVPPHKPPQKDSPVPRSGTLHA